MTADFRKALPPDGRNAILEALGMTPGTGSHAGLSEVTLETQRLVEAEEEGSEGLYFPISCLLCRLVSLPEGTTVKVSLVGREGMAGGPALADTSMSAFRTVVQLPGKALFLPKRQARRLVDRPGAAETLVRYGLLLLRETSLTAACNRTHSARQRLARWLLLIRDRAGRDEFPLTHESLSAMLGVRRESVTLSANELRTAQAIEYRRATVAITSRSKLEKQSCSCYGAVTDSYVRFLKAEINR
jgi:CRP-like cAMP-binding protein